MQEPQEDAPVDRTYSLLRAQINQISDKAVKGINFEPLVDVQLRLAMSSSIIRVAGDALPAEERKHCRNVPDTTQKVFKAPHAAIGASCSRMTWDALL